MTRRFFSFSIRRLLCFVILLVCLAGTDPPAFAQFETRATAAFPQGAYSIAEGDFNNDGKLDVVVLVDEGFAVALGNGDGTFQKPVYHRRAQLAYSLAVGDFNNDGNLDIVFANLGPSTVDVYLGNGDGTFKAPISSNTTEGSYFVAVGDFNNDKKMDLAIIDPPYISVLLGNGDGTFQAPSDNSSFPDAVWLALADFNNDHNLDVVAVEYSGASYSLGVLLGNGNGTLQDSITTPLEYVPASVAAGDMNHDGNMDAVVGNDLGGATVFLGDGNGSFRPGVSYEATGIASGIVVVSDLNLDGNLDVADPSGPSPGVDVFWGNGDGTLQPAVLYPTGASSGTPVVGDLNGDGLPDFTFATSFLTTTMLNTGVVSFSPTTAPLSFPVQLINTVGKQQSVKLTNNGKNSLLISSTKVSGPFSMTTTCKSSLAAGATCSLSAEFKPKVAGTQTGLITINDSASSKPQFVELSGSATAIKLSPTSLTFGDQKVGTKSGSQTVTATNQGTKAVTFSSVGVGSEDNQDFSASGNCTPDPIEPGASCTMSVAFDPTQTGARSASLYFNFPPFSSSVSPAPVALSGTGD
jgi:hypothetical protein